MGYRNIVISSGNRLTVKSNQLLIDGEEVAPIEDLNSLLIENRKALPSAYLLSKCAENGVAVYFCDEKHMPSSVLLPFVSHSRHLKMLGYQLNAGKPLQKRIWQHIVQGKIGNQAKCLEFNQKEGVVRLNTIRDSVQSGDKNNAEATAASFYFRKLFHEKFIRREDDLTNAALNYGYAIIRGMIARTLVGHGLEPSIGVNHHNELNSFNLADDMIEPFRPLVDMLVISVIDEHEEMTPDLKKALVNVVNYDMCINGEKHIVSSCIDVMVESFCRSLQNGKEEMIIPELIPLQKHSYE